MNFPAPFWQDDENPPTVKAELEIRRNTDGVVRKYKTDWDYCGDFIWADGNYACDCNRHLFFCRAIGDEAAENERIECGSTQYSVKLTDKDGKLLYCDYEDV